MKTLKFFLVMLLAVTLSACTANKLSTENAKIPFNQAVKPHSKILVVSSVNNLFVLQHDYSEDSYYLRGGDLDPIILQTAAQTLTNAGYDVVTAKWVVNTPIARVLSESNTAGTPELKSSVIKQLESLNANYHADYVLIMTGTGSLKCSVSGSSPVAFTMQTFLIDVRSGNVLYWYSNNLIEGPTHYSSKSNQILCKEISSSPIETSKKIALKQWLRIGAEQLTKQNILELFSH